MSKKQKNRKEGPFGFLLFQKKVAQCRKTEKWDPLLSPGNVCYAEKKKNLFGSVPWANGYNLNICLNILVTSGVLKKN